MLRSNLSPLLPALALLLRITTARAAEPLQVRTEGARFVGATGCKSSSCHGGAGEKRSQFITWTRQDFHARGYAILTNARSQRIAETLGVATANTSSRCTVCHSPFQAVTPARRIATANPTEGVSCESCHGAAEPWLRGHTRKDWTYATRIGAGMRDLKSFYVRANTCVACHQNLDADIAAAGHPDLIFEMDRQTMAQPKHWRDPEGSAVRAWLVGQAVALRETSWKLAQNPAGNEQTLAQWQGLVWLLAKVTASESSLLPVELPQTNGDQGGFTRTQQQADALARRAAQQNFAGPFARRILIELTETGPEFAPPTIAPRETLFRRAERLLLAVEALDDEEKVLSEHVSILRGDLRSAADFDSAQFAAHLARLRDALPSRKR